MEHTPEKAKRLAILKQLIKDLHAGAAFDEIKRRFGELIRDVSPGEIADMEQALIAEGMPEEEIKRLCDVHAALFADMLKQPATPQVSEGHPVHTFQLENRALGEVAKELRLQLAALGDPPDADEFKQQAANIRALLEQLAEVEKHYLRKENQLFPVMEQVGITGPPKVMWAVHDDIRALLKSARKAVADGDATGSVASGMEFLDKFEDMITKEENILFPMALEKLSDENWTAVRTGEEEIGYALIEPREYADTAAPSTTAAPPSASEHKDALQLSTGALTLEQVNLMLTHLPVDVSFVDENDEVRYYSDVKDRIFPRSPGVIGRKVQNCHPPASVHIVQRILDAFRGGEKDVAEFWIELQGKFIHIRYFAVRDSNGDYRGTLEVSQDITGIRKLKGERRLVDW
ncbi:DUF438 domain-containing protein [bacterium]|nr:DUF438 domain-containing protein [bacterium]